MIEIGLNDDLESVGININQEYSKESPEKNNKDTTIRKLDYQDTNNIVHEDMFQLTPHILNESKTYDGTSSQGWDTGFKNSRAISNNFINITNHLKKSFEKAHRSENREKTPEYKRNKEDVSEATPKMIISVERKSSPSSYLKGSHSHYSNEEQEDNQGILGFNDIISDTETNEFLNYYFNDIIDQINLGRLTLI